MIRHIVMWKFKDGEEENVNAFLTSLAALSGEMDIIKKAEVGRNAAPGSNYDAVLISEFESFEDLETYKNDPRHKKVSSLCKAIRVDRCAVDYEIETGN